MTRFGLDDVQAQAILDMRLKASRAWTGRSWRPSTRSWRSALLSAWAAGWRSSWCSTTSPPVPPATFRSVSDCPAMVTKYGMSERLGTIAYGNENDEVFIGRTMPRPGPTPRRWQARSTRRSRRSWTGPMPGVKRS